MLAWLIEQQALPFSLQIAAVTHYLMYILVLMALSQP